MLSALATRLAPGVARRSNPIQPPKAALLVIGDEILSGAITDANTPWLAKTLHARGVDLVRVEYCQDSVRDIVDSVLDLKRRVGSDGWVFTSGGLGATHDDLTYPAIAAAFGGELQRHAPTVRLMEEHYAKRGVELNEARLRMADLPHPADEVLTTPGLWVPLVVIQNVFVLPGIPGLFQQMISANLERFRGPQAHEATLYTNLGEGDLAVELARVAGVSPRVRIGSYPNVDLNAIYGGSEYRVKIQLESRDPEALQAAVELVKSKLPTFQL